MGRTIDTAFEMLFKFSKKCHLESLQKGKLYMRNLQYYIDLEIASGKIGVGDRYDGLMPLVNANVTAIDNETNALIMKAFFPVAQMNFGYTKHPAFCTYMLDYRNYRDARLNGSIMSVDYQVPDNHKNDIRELGNHVLIIKDGTEFIRRIEAGFENEGLRSTRDLVKYYDDKINTLQHMQDVYNNNYRIAFWKRKGFEPQQEYRFFILNREIETDDSLTVDIGNIEDITQIITTEEMLNMRITIDCMVAEKP